MRLVTERDGFTARIDMHLMLAYHVAKAQRVNTNLVRLFLSVFMASVHTKTVQRLDILSLQQKLLQTVN